MEDQRIAAIGVDQPIFRAAAKPGHVAPVSRWRRSAGTAGAGPAASRLDAGDRAGPRATGAGRGRWFRLREVRASMHANGVDLPPQAPARATRAMNERSPSATKRSRPRKRRAVSAPSSRAWPRSYDMMNDAMSGGMHRLWKDRFVRRVKPRAGEDDPRHGRRHRRHRLPPGRSRRRRDRRRHQPGDARSRHGAGAEARDRRPGLVAGECRGADASPTASSTPTRSRSASGT